VRIGRNDGRLRCRGQRWRGRRLETLQLSAHARGRAHAPSDARASRGARAADAAVCRELGIQAVLVIPIASGNRTFGLLMILRGSSPRLSRPRTSGLVNVMVEQTALVLLNARLLTEQRALTISCSSRTSRSSTRAMRRKRPCDTASCTIRPRTCRTARSSRAASRSSRRSAGAWAAARRCCFSTSRASATRTRSTDARGRRGAPAGGRPSSESSSRRTTQSPASARTASSSCCPARM
jgi:hypothetical protein